MQTVARLLVAASLCAGVWTGARAATLEEQAREARFQAVLAARGADRAVACPNALFPLVPQLDALVRPFDMVKGTQNASNSSQPAAVLYPIWSFTCDLGQTFTITEPTFAVYAVPDQVQAFAQPSLAIDINAALLANMSSYWSYSLKSFSFGVGLSLTCGGNTKCLGLNANYNHEAYNMQSQFAAGLQYSGFSTVEYTYYQLGLAEPPFGLTQDPYFLQLLNMLPPTISTPADQRLYNMVLAYYGTHVASTATVGGSFHTASFVSQNFFNSQTASWTMNQFRLEFSLLAFDLGITSFTNKSQINITDLFSAASTNYVFFKGGNPTLMNESSLAQWAASIFADPAWNEVRLLDVTDAIPLSMPQQANTLLTVLKYYMANGAMPPATDDLRNEDVQAALEPFKPTLRESYPHRWFRRAAALRGNAKTNA